MSVALYTHARCLEHDPGPGHPESPARLAAVLVALDDPRFALLDRIDAPRATHPQVARVHRAELIDQILRNVPQAGWVPRAGDPARSRARNKARSRSS